MTHSSGRVFIIVLWTRTLCFLASRLTTVSLDVIYVYICWPLTIFFTGKQKNKILSDICMILPIQKQLIAVKKERVQVKQS